MFTLRPYQSQAVQKTIEHFSKTKEPAIIVLPTGAGKSLVIADLAIKSKGRVLVLAHVKELVEQNHKKYEAYGHKAGIFSASLNKKETNYKATFASIQSFINSDDQDLEGYSLVIIDECHRISLDKDSQYQTLMSRINKINRKTCILGLTATPYRLDSGWIYNFHYQGSLKTSQDRFFKKCIFELPLSFMIKHKYLAPPVLIDSPVASYDFSKLFEGKQTRSFSEKELNKVLNDQARITPTIIDDIVKLSEEKNGVMIFTSTVNHAKEILELLPEGRCGLIIGSLDQNQRDLIIKDFKNKKIKFLVNVSVLTTGFDAPHVDLIAILRPTESISLYQQIVGRGLRLYPGKEECLVLDYTGMAYNIFSPQIDTPRPTSSSVPVEIKCPMCFHKNTFWGTLDMEGNIEEHFGRSCQGAKEIENVVVKCEYLFRYKRCPECESENDISARVCRTCDALLFDPDKKLKEARSLKDAHIMRVENMYFAHVQDKKGREKLEISYYDVDGNELKERYSFEDRSHVSAFYYNFIRSHVKLAGKRIEIKSIEAAMNLRDEFRTPIFIIARLNKKVWKIREKIFIESIH